MCYITKHLMTAPSGKICSVSLKLRCFLRLSLGKHRDSRETKQIFPVAAVINYIMSSKLRTVLQDIRYRFSSLFDRKRILGIDFYGRNRAKGERYFLTCSKTQVTRKTTLRLNLKYLSHRVSKYASCLRSK